MAMTKTRKNAGGIGSLVSGEDLRLARASAVPFEIALAECSGIDSNHGRIVSEFLFRQTAGIKSVSAMHAMGACHRVSV